MNPTGSHSQTNAKLNVVAIIPARFGSTRLHGKALLEIAGKPMIVWVAERVLAARNIDRLIVATDDERIRTSVERAGLEVAMTRSDHASGTDRLAEVAADMPEAEIIVNVQGDEPLISPLTIERAIEALREEEEAGIATAWEAIDLSSDVINPSVVKIVVSDEGRAIYFSRAAVPYPRDSVERYGTLAAALASEPELLRQFKKHTGLYVYRRDVLLDFMRWPQTDLEKSEGLEQLRALEHGVRIKAVEAAAPSIGVDNADDLERVRAIVGVGTL